MVQIIDNPRKFEKFDQTYKDRCFQLWWGAGKPAPSTLLCHKDFPVNAQNSKPSTRTLIKWVSLYKWHKRAKVLDNEVGEALKDKDIAAKVEMLHRQTKTGIELQEIGLKFFDDNEVTSEHVALKLILDGARLERESRGIPALFEKALKMDDDTLADEIMKRLTGGQVIIEPIDESESTAEIQDNP